MLVEMLSSEEEEAALASPHAVELGFLQRELPADWSLLDGGKAGGRPAWLEPRDVPPPAALRCGVCRSEMTFLLQAYAPLDGVDAAYHRVLYFWCCKNGICLRENAGGAGAVRVLRAQLPRTHAFLDAPQLGDCDDTLPPLVALDGAESAALEARRIEGNRLFAASEWTAAIREYTAALEWFDEALAAHPPTSRLDSAAPLCATEALRAERSLRCNLAAALLKRGGDGDARAALAHADRAVAIEPSFAKAHYRRRVSLQTLGRTREAAAAHRRTLELQLAPGARVAGAAPALAPQGLVFEMESPGAAAAAAAAIAAMHEEDEEEDADDIAWRTANQPVAPGRNMLDDPATLAFHKRMAGEPSQCVRYHPNWRDRYAAPAAEAEAAPARGERFDGAAPPLWAGSQRRAKAFDIPSCARCGATRVCEVQLMPQLLYLLGVDRDAGAEGEAMDWETIAVYSCPNPACVGVGAEDCDGDGAATAIAASKGVAGADASEGRRYGSYVEHFAWVQADASSTR